MAGTNSKHAFVHLPLLVVSIIAAFALGYSHWLTDALKFSGGSIFGVMIVSLVAGIFYSSVFTVAPATVALFQIGASGASIPLVAICGGVGAMLADISIFEILKFTLIDDIIAYFQRRSQGRFAHLFRIRYFRILIAVLGAITIATPLPDEIGLAMMGIGKAKLPLITIISFTLNSIGIAVIGLLARSTA